MNSGVDACNRTLVREQSGRDLDADAAADRSRYRTT
jgi:hypothetical protein